MNAAARESVRALVLDAEARYTLTRTKMTTSRRADDKATNVRD